MRPQTFRRVMGRNPQRTAFGSKTITTPQALDPGALYHYWYPERDGVRQVADVDPAFATRLRETSRDLAMVKPPDGAPMSTKPWLMWYRKPSVTHKLCPGWLLLFAWQDGATKVPLPLDDRVFANLYHISATTFGGAEAYFKTVVKQLQADRERSEATDKANTDAKKKEFLGSMKISTAGKGNRFALHHDGTVVPSRSEANWTRENAMRTMPGEQAKALRERQVKRRRKS